MRGKKTNRGIWNSADFPSQSGDLSSDRQIMDTELKELLETVIRLLKRIDSNTDDISYIKMDLSNLETEVKKIREKVCDDE